jgi:hypothetical protein
MSPSLLVAALSSQVVSGAPFGNGVNLQPSYYAGGNVDFDWDFMKTFSDIETVRIEIEPGHEDQAVNWIAAAKSNGLHVVATYHKCTVLGSNDASELAAAGDWWAANYHKLSAAGDFTINLKNEWGDHSLSASAYAGAVSAAIAKVRTVYNGPVVLDVPGWGQESKTAADAFALLPDKNVIFSMHVYPQGWNQGYSHHTQASDIDDIAGLGAGCVLGEFGGSDYSQVNVPERVSYAKSRGCAVLGWAWTGDGGDLNMLSPSWSESPQASSHEKSGYFDTIYGLLGHAESGVVVV